MPNDRPGGEDRSVLARPAAEPTATWRYGPHRDQAADVFLPTRATAALLVLVHGGFWRPEYDRGHLRALAAALSATGHPVVSLEYRRIPRDPDAAISDLRRALAALAERPPHGITTSPPIAIGHSAGGQLVLVLAADRTARLRGAVALAPVADLVLAESLGLDGDAVPAFLGAAASARADLDPSALPTPTVPVTLLHGVQDSVVPIGLSRSYVAATHGHAQLHELPDAAHFELIDPQTTAFRELLNVVDRTGIE